MSNVERVLCLYFVFGYVLFLIFRLLSFGENLVRLICLLCYLKMYGYVGNKNVVFDLICCLGVVCLFLYVNFFF